ncbi:MAG: GWxTD domain-containing protein [Bacteroidota bacterium]
MNLFGDTNNVSRLDILYRISYDYFIFVRDTTENPNYPFIGRGDLVVDLLDSTGTSVARKIIHKQLGIQEQRTINSEKAFVQGIISFQLNPGLYSLVTELTDKESNRRYFNDKLKVNVKNFSLSRLSLSDFILTDIFDMKNDSVQFSPLNLSGDVPFGKNFNVYVELPLNQTTDSLSIISRLKRILPDGSYEQFFIQDTIGKENFFSSAKLEMTDGEHEARYRLVKTSHNGYLGVRIKVKGDTLEEGEYELSVICKTPTFADSLIKRFQIRWFDSPASLRQPEIVLRVMEYVMNDTEYSHYKSANKTEKIKLFKDYWKHRDPMPQTAYNEALAEYFRRVDYTITAFSTLNNRDGYRWDRGKAYIIYGSPGKIERNLTGNSTAQEIWYYPGLHKKLVFEDHAHKSEYRLLTIESY